MSDQPHSYLDSLSPSVAHRLEDICDRFEGAWKAGQRSRIEEYLVTTTGPERSVLFRQLLSLELEYCHRRGEIPPLEEYLRRFPEEAEVVEALYRMEVIVDAQPSSAANPSATSEIVRPEPAGAGEAAPPQRLGRYRITAQLGQGGFGVVYKGYDDDLRR